MKKIVVEKILGLLSQGIKSVTHFDTTARDELRHYPDDFVFTIQVYQTDTAIHLIKKGNRLKRLKHKHVTNENFIIYIKSYQYAYQLMTGQLSIHQAYAQNRITIKGNLMNALPFVRIIYLVESYLFPNFMSKKLVKEKQKRSRSKLFIYMSILFRL